MKYFGTVSYIRDIFSVQPCQVQGETIEVLLQIFEGIKSLHVLEFSGNSGPPVTINV